MPSAGFKEKGPISSLRWGPSIEFFPGVKCLFSKYKFPSILVDPKQISVVSKNEKQKKKKKISVVSKNEKERKNVKKEEKKKGPLPPPPVMPCYTTGAL